MIAKIAEFGKKYRSELLLAVACVAIVLISFNAGRMSVLQQPKSSLEVLSPQSLTANAGQVSGGSAALSGATAQSLQDPRVVASKASSSHLYHFLTCPGAKQISEKNKLFFATEAAAIAAGYSLAGNCAVNR